MPELEFDEPTHTYTRDGVVLPSVTQVLTDEGYIDMRWFTEEGRNRGSCVAMITELYDTGKLDDRSKVPASLVGYLDAWTNFLADSGCEIVATEEMVCNPTYGYAGTLDRHVFWNGDEFILDIKTGAAAAWEQLQTAAYAGCLAISYGGTVGRAAIHLASNGKYRPYVHKYFARDWDVFRGALGGWIWKREHCKKG